jgi:soluble lytic murein transglycosylase-like protein
MPKIVLLATALIAFLPAQLRWFQRDDYFAPTHRLIGIGADRKNLSEQLLARRTEMMIESQSFGILRDPQALEGAQRVSSERLQKIFRQAERQSGLPASFIAAVAYLESWGKATAVSPAGPKGMMQIAEGTARLMGLKVVRKTRYRIRYERRKVRARNGKTVTRKVRRRIPYTVIVRDDRLVPSRAVPAAAKYLARLEERFGRRDWAVFAYHCGEGCVSELMNIIDRSDGLRKDNVSVPEAFFSSSPTQKRELYEALRYHMERDYSPTYWFRVSRAEELLKLYAKDPPAFRKLFSEYRNHANPNQRAPHRLSVWLRPEDFAYLTCEDLKREQGRTLVRAFDDSKFFGFSLRTQGACAVAENDTENQEYYLLASPAVVGTISYIAYETRRLHEAMNPKGERFVPLEVTALVQPLDYEQGRLKANGQEMPSHCTGQVFDIYYGNLPPGQREALEFVLDDLGWEGYLGFIRDSSSDNTLHIGAAPSARSFFAKIYNEALEHTRQSD